ncbi:DUF2145 domain-containing protein [Zoogloeaceae bacterium G21618-S1]|nr:DUF2145 domain-containing protein [Zoogloeaceae bacterium G21618-S1]
MTPHAFLTALCLLPLLAHAGQNCEARKLTANELRQSLELAASTARALDRSGAQVVVLARAGQDLSDYRLRYSHLGIAYRDGRVWRVVHKLNACGSDRGALYRQGLAEFFSDGLYRYEAGVVVLDTGVQAKVLPALQDNTRLSRLHEARYNMVAYPWSTQYQQSNQWAIETLAMLLDPAADTRPRAQAWLRLRDYRPTTLEISALKRFGARVGTAHIDFDDHPFGRRMAGHIDTVTVDSVFDWLARSGLGGPAQVVASDTTPPRHPPNGLMPAVVRGDAM